MVWASTGRGGRVMAGAVVGLLVLAACPLQCQARIGTFWHVTDFHYDINYTTTGDPTNMCWDASGQQRGSVGKFGDYSCDAPLTLVKSAIKAMVKLKSDPDFILWTGDDTAHVSDKHFSTDKVVEIVETLSDILGESFPNTSVIPVLGNHDYYPKNQMAVGENELQSRVADLWKEWLNDLNGEAYHSFSSSGRFWADVPGSRVTVVALNTLIWYKNNNNTAHLPDGDPSGDDPNGQFSWADYVLTMLTLRSRRVYLVGHIPPGTFERYLQEQEGFHWYQPRYNERFIQLVQKHAGVIEAQFFGHHHTDSYRLIFDEEYTKPLSYLMLAPGVTPWRSTLSEETGANNPGIRLVSYNTETGQVVEVSTYFLNLTKANLDSSTEWQLEYNFSDYKLSSIKPSALFDLAKDMRSNTDLFDLYYSANTVSLEDPSVCNATCRLLHWCAITEVDYTRFYNCNRSCMMSWTSLSLLAPLVALLAR